jgi:exoribonuclease R
LSDNICSLIEGQRRPVFLYEIDVDDMGNILGEPHFKNEIVYINKNWHYDDPRLLVDPHYCQLLDLTKKMDNAVSDSHELVAFWMIAMNYACSKYMAENRFGIFRSVKIPSSIRDTNNLLEIWRNTKSSYVLYNENSSFLSHDSMSLDTYVHITSPIRRLVDLLNQLAFCLNMGIVNMSPQSSQFLEKWTNKLDYINLSTKNIRKVQTECDLLHRILLNPELTNTTYIGSVVELDETNYMVYLDDLKFIGKVRFGCHATRDDIKLNGKYEYRIYLFNDEYQSRKKVRIGPA